jgi:hypothetical protein
MGVIVSKETRSYELRSSRTTYGNCPGSLETWLLLRSLRTLDLRVKQQSKNSVILAKWLSTQSEISKVWHTSLKDHPSYELAKKQFKDDTHPPMISIELNSKEEAKLLPELCKVFISATSLGSVESLIEWRYKHDESVNPTLIRISVGIENVEDLIADLDQALKTLKSKDSTKIASNFNNKSTLEDSIRLKISLESLEDLKERKIISKEQFETEKSKLFKKYGMLSEVQLENLEISRFLPGGKKFQKSTETEVKKSGASSEYFFEISLSFSVLFLSLLWFWRESLKNYFKF